MYIFVIIPMLAFILGGLMIMCFKNFILVALMVMTASCSVVNVDLIEKNQVDYNYSESDVLNIILAKIHSGVDDYSLAIEKYELANSVSINQSVFELISIYEKLNMINELKTISKRIVESKIKPTESVNYYYMILANAYAGVENNNYGSYIESYVGGDNLISYDDYDGRLLKIINISKIMSRFKLNINNLKVDRDTKTVLNHYYLSGGRNLYGDALKGFVNDFNDDNLFHHFVIFKNLYLSGSSPDYDFISAKKLLNNTNDQKLDFIIIDASVNNIDFFNYVRKRLDDKYSKSIDYSIAIYNLGSVSERGFNIKKAYDLAFNDLSSYSTSNIMTVSNFIAYKHIYENHNEMSDSEIYYAFSKISNDEQLSNKALSLIIDDMIFKNNFRINLLKLIDGNYKHSIALNYYNREFFNDSYNWLSNMDDSEDNIDVNVLKVLSLSGINIELAISEARRLVLLDSENTDYKILLNHLIFSKTGSVDSIRYIIGSKEFEELNFLIESIHTYNIMNLSISEYYINIGDYNKATNVLNEIGNYGYKEYAMLGKLYSKLGLIDEANINFNKSRSIIDSLYLRKILDSLN